MSAAFSIFTLATVQPGELDLLSLYGFLSAAFTLGCWACQAHFKSLALAAGFLQMNLAVYAFLAGAWPLALVVVVSAFASLRRWRPLKKLARRLGWFVLPHHPAVLSTRMERMFDDGPRYPTNN